MSDRVHVIHALERQIGKNKRINAEVLDMLQTALAALLKNKPDVVRERLEVSIDMLMRINQD